MIEPDRNKLWNQFWYRLFLIVLRFSFLLYLFCAVAENLNKGFVSYYFPLNMLLYLTTGAGLIVFLLRELPRQGFDEHKTATSTPPLILTLCLLVLVAFVAFLLIYVQLRQQGKIALFAGIFGGLVSSILVVWVLRNWEDPPREKE